MKCITLFTLIFYLTITGCEEKDEFDFGESETDFVTGSVYKTSSAGFLFVKAYSNVSSAQARILADTSPTPVTELALLKWNESVTLPLPSNTYWCIKSTCTNSCLIRWTPVK